MRVAIVGGGVAGLSAARHLRGLGHEPTVYEAVGQVGGRLRSVRRHGTVIDVGAQYLTMRDPRLVTAVQPMRDLGALVEWCDELPAYERGQVVPPVGDRVMRYIAPEGMGAVGRFLAEDTEVLLGRRVDDIATLPGDAVIVALPPRAARSLVPGSPLVESAPCLTLAAGYGAVEAPDWKGLFVNGHDLLQWVAVDSSKRGGGQLVVVAHLVNDVRPPPEQVVDEVSAVLGTRQRPEWIVTEWWEEARIAAPLDAGAVSVSPGVVVAGDWCAGSRVEGAFLSGIAAAEMVAGGA